MNAAWVIPFIIVGGMLQAVGAAMNGRLHKSITNAWLASAISFTLITFFFTGMFLILPNPLPTLQDVQHLPWWAIVGGLVGAVQVYAGLSFVNKVGAGPFMGFTVTASLIASLAIDHFGWFRMHQHSLNPLRSLGAGLLICGVTLIAKF